MTTERWRSIPGWEGYYEVSDYGNVRSVDRTITRRDGQKRRFKGKQLAQATNRHGYPMVVLSRPGITKSMKVHRLVLSAFIGPPQESDVCCHANGIRHDNRLTNLRWGTQSENMFDRRRHGTDHQAKKTHCPQGHPYDEANTKVIPSRPTARYCRECHRQRSTSRWHLYKKEAA